METYDLIVVGLGAVGSAALCQSALRGARVLGIDRFHPPHELGSSHGETRITRQAIGEGMEFAPLVLRTNVLWRALEAATGQELMVQNGGLMLLDAAGQADSQGAGAAFYRRTADCAKRFGIAHQLLTAKVSAICAGERGRGVSRTRSRLSVSGKVCCRAAEPGRGKSR